MAAQVLAMVARGLVGMEVLALAEMVVLVGTVEQGHQMPTPDKR